MIFIPYCFFTIKYRNLIAIHTAIRFYHYISAVLPILRLVVPILCVGISNRNIVLHCVTAHILHPPKNIITQGVTQTLV